MWVCLDGGMGVRVRKCVGDLIFEEVSELNGLFGSLSDQFFVSGLI